MLCPDGGQSLKERISEFPVAPLERTMSGKAPAFFRQVRQTAAIEGILSGFF